MDHIESYRRLHHAHIGFSNILFCEGLGRPGRKLKESEAMMENIPPTMVLHKHVDEADTRFSTMEGPLTNNNFGGYLGVIRGGTYQAASEDIRWAY